MSLAQGNNTPTRPRIEPGSPDPESDALTTRPVRPLLFFGGQLVIKGKYISVKLVPGSWFLVKNPNLPKN